MMSCLFLVSFSVLPVLSSADRLPLRLTGGADTCSGRVEVYHGDSWGTVCGDSWDLRDAMVVCRQLGCGPALRAEGGGRFGRGDGAIWLDEVNCKGSELDLWHCSYSLKQSDCSHRQDAWVTCAEPNPHVTGPPTVIYMQTGQSDPAGSPVVLWILISGLLLLVVRLECMNWILLRDHRNKNETKGTCQHPASEDLSQTPSGSGRIQGDSRHRQAQTMGTLWEMKKLQLSVDNYISETLSYIQAVQAFTDKGSEWFCKREEEMNKMKDIKERANNMKIKLRPRIKSLEKELSAVVKDVISGLKELQPFLEALEKLAVTSPFVFDERVFSLPAGNTVTDVISFIHAARMSCGLLVHFKKDTESIFQPNLVNVEILASELQRMIHFSQDICEIMEKRCKNIVFPRWNFGEHHTCPEFYSQLSLDTVKRISNHVNDLSKIRANEDFRLTFMFRNEEKSLKFIDLLNKQKTNILGSLEQMEACAVKLEKIKKGVNISSVAGSTVGVSGGVVSIVGLALAPVTLGASTILTLVGGVMGAVSGANSLTTGVTELAINAREKKKFSEIYQHFLKKLEPILESLAQVMIIKDPSAENGVVDYVTQAGKVSGTAITVYRTVDVALDCGNVMKFTDAASDFAEIGGVAKAAPTVLSVPLRAVFIAGNSALIGLDLFSIVNNSISLANGSKSDVSKAFRGHVDFWKIHLEAWERICDSLLRGKQDFQESEAILKKPFYPEL